MSRSIRMRFPMLAATATALALCATACSSKGGGANNALPDAGTPDGGALTCNPATLPGSMEAGHWDPRFTIAGFSGHDGLAPAVYDFARDRDGSLLATGRFQWLGRQRVEPLMRLVNGQWQPARTHWELPVPGTGFSAIAIGPDGELALATYSTLSNHGAIWLDSGSGFRSLGEFDGKVRRMAWFGGKLWVIGNFGITVGEDLVRGVALWDGSGWAPAPGGAVDGPVFALLLKGSRLFIGGDFNNVGGIVAHKIADFDGTTWTAHDFDLGPGTIYTLAVEDNGEIYAGGALFRDPEEGVGGIAHWDGTAWSLLGGGVASGYIPGVVSDLLVQGGKVTIAGCFSAVGGRPEDENAVKAQALARWNGTAWEALNDGMKPERTAFFMPFSCGDEGPTAVWDMKFQRLFADGARMFVGGFFPSVDGVASQSIIARENDQWIAQGTPEFGVTGEVRELASGGSTCSVYAIGALSHAGGAPAFSGVIRHDGAGWQPVGSPFPRGYDCSHLAVSASGDVFVGCVQWDSPDGNPKSTVYRLQGEEWATAGDASALGGVLFNLGVDPVGRLWIVGGGEKGYVARLDGDQFTVVEDGFEGPVFYIAFKPQPDVSAEPDYVVAGVFTKVGDQEIARIARRDGNGWAALGAGLNASPTALEYGADGIYVATNFEGDESRFTLARWDGQAWTELATPERGLPKAAGDGVHTFYALRALDGGRLLAGGNVWPETGGRGVFLFDGERFTPFAGGVAAMAVSAVALAPDGVWVGGSIAEVGQGDTRLPSVGVAHFLWNSP